MTNHKHKRTTRVMVGPITDVTAPTAADLENMTDITDAFATDEAPAPIRLTDEWPPPVVFLNYPGYHLGQLGQIRGPMLSHTQQDQLLTVVSESYDPTTHTTRHGLTYGIVSKRVAVKGR